MLKFGFAAAALASFAFISSAQADTVVFQSGDFTNFFTPFDSSSSSDNLFADSGWFGSGSDAGVVLKDITLHLVTFSDSGLPMSAGTTDINFTFNDGDPSGDIFGTAAELYSTTLTNVVLPAASGVSPTAFDLTIPLPGVFTLGGFNNVGFSIGVENFDFDGSFGFQTSEQFNYVGFYTELASEYEAGDWSQFSFGPNPFTNMNDMANLRMTITAPEPATLSVLAGAGLIALRRKR